MTTTTHGSLRGHRVDEIHAHREHQTRSVWPWVILGLIALSLLGWAFQRNRHHGLDTSEFQRGAQMSYERTSRAMNQSSGLAPSAMPLPR